MIEDKKTRFVFFLNLKLKDSNEKDSIFINLAHVIFTVGRTAKHPFILLKNVISLQ